MYDNTEAVRLNRASTFDRPAAMALNALALGAMVSARMLRQGAVQIQSRPSRFARCAERPRGRVGPAETLVERYHAENAWRLK